MRLDIGKHIVSSATLKEEIQNLCKNLIQEDKIRILRQITRFKQCYENNEYYFTNISKSEIKELSYIKENFLSRIFELRKDLFCYDDYFLPINAFEMSTFWHKHNLHILNPQTLAKIKQKDIIDAGGFIGDSAIIFERQFTDKNIYTFEPTSKNYELMKQTLRLNNATRVVPIKKALGGKTCTATISVSGGASSLSLERSNETESIEVITLDEFVKERNLQVGFIKVDVEGAEMDFLQGAKETICTQKPAMLVSLYHQAGDYFHIKPLIESWNLGYSFRIYKGIDLSVLDETALYCELLQ